jgi:hypothetical protein
MGDNDEEPMVDFTRDVSRRQIMQAGGGLAVFGLAAPAAGTFEPEDFDVMPMDQVEEVEIEEQGLQYFTIRQARVVHDLTARIYPSDENGPGAPEAGVVYFIDRQLNSAWGHGERWYMEPPFAGEDPTQPFEADSDQPEDVGGETEVPFAETTPAETQGWQYRLTANEAYDQAIYAIEESAQQEYDVDSFTGLNEEQQDEVVSALQNDEVSTFEQRDIDGNGFFLLLRQNTLEGMFSDPMYGGNREMIGWRLKGFPGTPGALGSYRQVIDEGEFIELEEGDFRKLADDVASLDFDRDNQSPAPDRGEGHRSIQPLDEMEDVEPRDDHSHVHDAAESDYPKVVDEEAARGEKTLDDNLEDGGDE